MKKLISFALVFAMLFAIAIPSSAVNNNVQVEILSRKEDANGNLTELSKLGDFYYYFEKNNNEIISMSLAPDGTIDKYVRNIDSNVMKHFTSTNNSANFISSANENLQYVETIIINTHTSNIANPMAVVSSRDHVANELINKHSNPYSGRFIGLRNEAGYQCSFYETHTHNIIMNNRIHFKIGTTLAAISAGTGAVITLLIGTVIPTSIVDWTLEKITEPMDIDSFSAKAMYTQFAYINNVSRATAGKTYSYTGFTSVYGAAFLTEVVTTDAAFDNFESLALIAIGNL